MKIHQVMHIRPRLSMWASLLLTLVMSLWTLPWHLGLLWPLWPLVWLLWWSSGLSRLPLPTYLVCLLGMAMDFLTASIFGLHILLYLLIFYSLQARRWNIEGVTIIPQPVLVILLILFYVFIQGLVLNPWLNLYGILYAVIRGLVTYFLWFVFIYHRAPQQLHLKCAGGIL